jgi:hypothetical protein
MTSALKRPYTLETFSMHEGKCGLENIKGKVSVEDQSVERRLKLNK